MKQDSCGHCPGCGKHCSLNQPRCKYGREYAAKIEKKRQDAMKQPAGAKAGSCDMKKHQYKWEKYVEKDSLAWKFLSVSCLAKKALRREQITQEQLFHQFSPLEMLQFSALLDKLQRQE